MTSGPHIEPPAHGGKRDSGPHLPGVTCAEHWLTACARGGAHWTASVRSRDRAHHVQTKDDAAQGVQKQALISGAGGTHRVATARYVPAVRAPDVGFHPEMHVRKRCGAVCDRE